MATAYLVLEVAGLTAAYGGVIGGLVWVLRKAAIPARWAICLGFLIFGLASGLLIAWAWPLDSSVYPNVWATLLGDWLYGLFPDDQTTPWLLRVPRVYVFSSTLLAVGAGLTTQWLHSWHRNRHAEGVG